MAVVVKIGTSSLTDDRGQISVAAIEKLCAEVAEVRARNIDVIIVTSAAISAGLPALGYDNGERPKDMVTLQAAAAVGQSRLLGHYDRALDAHGLVGGQILVSPHDFFERRQYLHVRDTLARLLQLGIVPIVNENDAVADDEIRFGDNDRIAALVAHSIQADQLVLLTDMAGLFTADPRVDQSASLIAEVAQVDEELMALAGGAGTNRGSGGMASKLGAARMAAWSGVETVIAAAARDSVLSDAVAGVAGVGTRVRRHDRRLSARKLWIAFAVAPAGRIVVDDGARKALIENGRSLLMAGVRNVSGDFAVEAGLEIAGLDGVVFAKGLARHSSAELHKHLASDAATLPSEVVHRDDLVVF